MRYVNIVLGLLMLLFAFAQLNDPDALLWFFIYLIPGILALIAGFRITLLDKGFGAIAALAALSLAGVIYYWPKTPEFWRIDIWWETETAREGMGMMIVAAVLLVVLYSVWAARDRKEAADQVKPR